jgi:8-oxo-dGTP diphosphatase
MCFAVHVDPAQVRIAEPDMFDEYGWYSPDELPRPLHSQFDTFLELHGDKLRAIMTSV